MNATAILGSGLAGLWRATWQASVLVVLVLLVQWLFRARLTPSWRHALWWLVLIRLLLPVIPETSFSVFNLVRFEPMVKRATRIGVGLNDNPWNRPPASGKEDLLQGSIPASPAAAAATAPAPTGPEPIPASANAPASPNFRTAASPGHFALWLTFCMWLAGVLYLGARLMWGNYRFARRLGRRSPVIRPTVLAVLEECRQVVGVRQSLTVVETPEVDSPALFGCFRAKLLLPPTIAENFSPTELRHVFLHELSHVRRGDVPANWLMTLVQLAHWFNPVIWFAFSRMRADRELACDALALSLVKAEEGPLYGQTIIKLLEGFVRPAAVPGLVGILEDKSQMKRRISMIAMYKKSSRATVLALALLLGLGAVALTDAQTEKGGAKLLTAPSGPDDVIDPKTGLKFVVSKTIVGTNDIIEGQDRITMASNGKFLLWHGRVVPLDGRPAFTLEELEDVGIAAWSPDGHKIAFNAKGVAVLPVSPETGRPTGPARQLLEETEGWFRGKIYWSADSEQILFEKWNRRMEREVGTISLREGRLNKQPNYADFGLLSPDGNTIAYSVTQGGIWAKPVSGGASRITRARSGGWLFDDPVVWTPDSQWVASAVGGWNREEIHLARLSDGQNFDVFPPETAGTFIGKSADGKKLCFYRSSFEPRISLTVVPISGGPAFNVSPTVDFDDLDDHCWSSDSASLAVLGGDKEGNQQFLSIPFTSGDQGRFQIESLGTNALWLWSLSPDGKRVLYVAPGSDQGARRPDFCIAPISLKEGRATGPATLAFKGWQSPNPGVSERMGTWSPDCTKIAMPHKSDQGYELWVMFANGGQPVLVTQTPDEVGSRPQWSPDGKRIAFDLIAADREMLQMIPAEGGMAKTILTAPKGQFPPFDWSPDGKEIVVACSGTISGFPVTGSSARVIVRLQDVGYEYISWLGWSPDGQHLAFYGWKKGEAYQLCLFSPKTSKIAILEKSRQWTERFTWSPDSKMICRPVHAAQRTRPAGVIRELDVAEAVQKAPPIAERTPTTATTAPPVEPIAGPVFTDNFDNGPSKHWRFQDLPDQGQGAGRHAVENGELMLSQARASLDGFDWTDYIVTVRVCVKEWMASGLTSLAIATRAMPSKFGSGSMDRYCLGIFCNNNDPPYLWLGINYPDGSGALRHGEMSRSPCNVVRDKWYTLEFEVRGQHLRGYLDGKLMVEATDPRLTQGRIWFGASAGRTLFDDFSVRQLP